MKDLTKEILEGKIFIYPTDTIYGIGCDATNQEAVNKIKDIKDRERDKPLSIIAPSKEWIQEHCIIDTNLDKYFPGPYTLILKKKDSNFLSHISNTDSLGIRMPDNEFCKQVQEIEKPFVTTSVNLSHEPFATEIAAINPSILEQVDHIIEQEGLSGKPSTLIINGNEIKR